MDKTDEQSTDSNKSIESTVDEIVEKVEFIRGNAIENIQKEMV
ncbi:MAG: hypothetical protein PHI35_08530 [Victivallaceae bacterium]|nr:hypothetical protein [Victivallaceae bacterium]